jgi:phosphopantothenoylcysteine synthetase/decarboxylase
VAILANDKTEDDALFRTICGEDGVEVDDDDDDDEDEDDEDTDVDGKTTACDACIRGDP